MSFIQQFYQDCLLKFAPMGGIPPSEDCYLKIRRKWALVPASFAVLFKNRRKNHGDNGLKHMAFMHIFWRKSNQKNTGAACGRLFRLLYIEAI